MICQVKNGSETATNGLLVCMPKEQLHGSISIIKQRLELAANMGKMRAIKHQMPLIPWSPSVTECASTQMPRDSWPSKPALLYWKRVGPHAKLHQQPKPGDWHGNLIVGLKRELTGTKNHAKYVQSLAPFEGAVLGDTWHPSQTLRSRSCMLT